MRRKQFVYLLHHLTCAISGLPVLRLLLTQEEASGDVLDPESIPEKLTCMNDMRRCLNVVCFDESVVGLLEAGYGSKYDGETFLIALADEAIDDLLAHGRITRVALF